MNSLYRKFISPVCLRSECRDEIDRKASWAELFFDLVFVIAITAASSLLYKPLTAEHIVQAIILISMLWVAWNAATFYANRFDADDPFHRALNIFQMLCICIITIHIPNAFGQSAVFFIVTYCSLRSILLLLYGRVVIALPALRNVVLPMGIYLLVSIIFWLISLYFDPPIRYYLWLVAVIIDLLMPLVLRNYLAIPQAQLSQSHLVERFGLFILIVLGESIAGLVHAVMSSDNLLMLIIGLLFIFSIWWLYFESMNNKPFADKFLYGLVWEYLNYGLIITLILLSAGLYHALLHPHDKLLLCSSASAVFVILSVLRRNIILGLCGIVMLFLIPLPIVWILTLSTLLGITAVLRQIVLQK